MIADFENGALDIALDVAEADYLAAQDGAYGEVTTKLFPKWDLLAVCLPEYNPAFDDIRVREAISLPWIRIPSWPPCLALWARWPTPS